MDVAIENECNHHPSFLECVESDDDGTFFARCKECGDVLTFKYTQLSPEPRYVTCVFATEGLPGTRTEKIDRLNVGDMTVWKLNTFFPCMQISLREHREPGDEMITNPDEFARLRSTEFESTEAARMERSKWTR